MYRTAIVEDDEKFAETLKTYLIKYGSENGLQFSTAHFNNAMAFLNDYKPDYDLIFMDIKMPYLNGMDAARQLRKADKDVTLVFVTSMSQFALSGYEVDATDFIVKPVSYYDFALKMSRVAKKLARDESREQLIVSIDGSLVKLQPADVLYVETGGHRVIYHTKEGEAFEQYSSLTAVENRLKGLNFKRCNSCYLVNLRYVRSVKGHVVNVGGVALQISQPRRKDFVKALMEYAGGGDN